MNILLNQLARESLAISLISQSQVVTALIVVVIFFGIILILGVRKSYLLKKENERLEKINTSMKEDEAYKDFTDGHMYGGN
ncbi:MAG: hypothetical protein P8K68_08265 [Algibacter sp.]|uniref:hypothetical protein n=1 Tax=Algibacter sp. TaxID=1872428 RepID=UPI002605C696|nr:hypothetical protein [Algibacter sp.]MDG1728705.1 hypothetical protein [Algibacter sp.]MDG2178764.1 hypothetical protein [Algibacter sp.]